MTEPTAPPGYHKRNAWAFGGDLSFYYIAMSLVGVSTVLPTLVKALSGSEIVVGIASGITTGAWLLPQLFIAGYSARLKQKLPFICRMVILTRPVMLVIAAALWLLAASHPLLTVVILLGGLAFFYVADALVSVPWFDLMAKGLPAARRGRVQGASLVIGGVAGIGIGLFVRYVLGDSSPWGFADNYALLFALSFVALCGSTYFVTRIVEPPAPEDGSPAEETLSTGRLLAGLPRIIAQDRPFLIMIIVRLLGGFVSVASAFYVLYATGEVGLSIQAVGLFVSAQVAGQLAAGFVIVFVQDKWGPRVHIYVLGVMHLLPPALALLAGVIGDGPWMLPLFLLVFFCLGLYSNSSGWPYFNWIMEHTDAVRRPLYIATSNTLGALFMLAPVLGGWLVKTFSFPAVFWAASLFGISGLLATRWLPSTRVAGEPPRI